jgi:hypothetical protein
VGGKKDLEDLIGVEVVSFSYPFGSFSPMSVALVRLSHARAVTATPGRHLAERRSLHAEPGRGPWDSNPRFAFDLTDTKQRLYAFRRRRGARERSGRFEADDEHTVMSDVL